MGKRRNPSNDDFDDGAFLGEQDFDVEAFIDSMDEENVRSRPKRRRRERAAWQRLDDWREQRYLKAQLDDWSWDLDDKS